MTSTGSPPHLGGVAVAYSARVKSREMIARPRSWPGPITCSETSGPSAPTASVVATRADPVQTQGEGEGGSVSSARVLPGASPWAASVIHPLGDDRPPGVRARFGPAGGAGPASRSPACRPWQAGRAAKQVWPPARVADLLCPSAWQGSQRPHAARRAASAASITDGGGIPALGLQHHLQGCLPLTGGRRFRGWHPAPSGAAHDAATNSLLLRTAATQRQPGAGHVGNKGAAGRGRGEQVRSTLSPPPHQRSTTRSAVTAHASPPPRAGASGAPCPPPQPTRPPRAARRPRPRGLDGAAVQRCLARLDRRIGRRPRVHHPPHVASARVEGLDRLPGGQVYGRGGRDRDVIGDRGRLSLWPGDHLPGRWHCPPVGGTPLQTAAPPRRPPRRRQKQRRPTRVACPHSRMTAAHQRGRTPRPLALRRRSRRPASPPPTPSMPPPLVAAIPSKPGTVGMT